MQLFARAEGSPFDMKYFSASLATLFLVSAMSGPCPAAAVKWAADVPMRDCDGVPCIDARLGASVEGLFVIDTGNRNSVVDDADAGSVGFGPANMKDGKIATAAHADAMVGAVALASLPVFAFPLKRTVDRGDLPHARGTLGYAALKDRVVQLDFIARRMRVSGLQPASAPCESSCGALHAITFGKSGPPVLVADGFALNGRPIKAQIDTFYTGALLTYGASIDRLGLADTAADAAQTEHFAFIDGGVDMRKSVAPSVTFAQTPLAQNAPLYFPAKGVHEPDGLFDGAVGLALMQSHVVTLDLHAMTIRIDNGATG